MFNICFISVSEGKAGNGTTQVALVLLTGVCWSWFPCVAAPLWPVLMLLFDIASSRLFFSPSQQPQRTMSFSLIGSRADPDRTLFRGTWPY